MAWASSGGYPGVMSDGTGGLRIVGLGDTGTTVLDGDGHINADAVAVIDVLAQGSVRANEHISTAGGTGLFNHDVPSAATIGGAATAGGTYTATEEAMLNAVYTALQSIGLIT